MKQNLVFALLLSAVVSLSLRDLPDDDSVSAEKSQVTFEAEAMNDDVKSG